MFDEIKLSLMYMYNNIHVIQKLIISILSIKKKSLTFIVPYLILNFTLQVEGIPYSVIILF